MTAQMDISKAWEFSALWKNSWHQYILKRKQYLFILEPRDANAEIDSATPQSHFPAEVHEEITV